MLTNLNIRRLDVETPLGVVHLAAFPKGVEGVPPHRQVIAALLSQVCGRVVDVESLIKTKALLDDESLDAERPAFPGLDFDVNWTHSGKECVVAYGDRGSLVNGVGVHVGVDMEVHNPKRLRVADRFYSPEEKAWLETVAVTAESLVAAGSSALRHADAGRVPQTNALCHAAAGRVPQANALRHAAAGRVPQSNALRHAAAGQVPQTNALCHADAGQHLLSSSESPSGESVPQSPAGNIPLGSASGEVRRVQEFFRLWCRKEALYKCVGGSFFEGAVGRNVLDNPLSVNRPDGPSLRHADADSSALCHANAGQHPLSNSPHPDAKSTTLQVHFVDLPWDGPASLCVAVTASC